MDICVDLCSQHSAAQTGEVYFHFLHKQRSEAAEYHSVAVNHRVKYNAFFVLGQCKSK